MKYTSLILLAFNIIFISCATPPQKKPSPAPVVEDAKAKMAIEKTGLDAAQAKLAQAHYDEALPLFQDFQKNYPQSHSFLAARLGEAQSLEGLEKWTEASNIYRSVFDTAMQVHPEIAALALYRLSFCYEALGDDIKSVAALLDSLKKQKYLPEEVVKAEIPARLAMLYGKVENTSEMNRYLGLAQKGVQSLQGRRDIPAGLLAKAYFEMGSVSMNQISTDNFSQAVLGQKAVQGYLFRAIYANTKPWSEEASSKLKKNYLGLWNVLVAMPGIDGVDAESLARHRRAKQIIFGGEFLDLIENAEVYKTANAEKMTQLEVDFFAYLAETKKQTQKIIYEGGEAMALTPESQKSSDVKKGAPLKDSEKPSAGKLPTTQDPNL